MADYIYLLQNRLTPAQFAALACIRDIARSKQMTVFLVGGAVRDLTAGSAVRDLDFALQGNPLKLKKDFQKAGFVLEGEHDPTEVLYLSFPGGVRLEVGATLSVTYPKPGKPVYKAAAILDDLRRRDFTSNGMALSLNEGSYGLLMDPLNGVADIENMELRLISNYGFIEDPVRMVRAARLSARLGWHLEEKTQQRYETGKSEGYITAIAPWQRGYELEEIVHEDDPVRVLRRLESEGWMKALLPAWTAAKANENELNKLRDVLGQLQSAGIYPDPSAAYFPLLTTKLGPKDVSELKKSFPRTGLVQRIEKLDADAKGLAAEFSSKAAATPSAAYKMLYAAVPEQVLSLAYGSKSAPVQARFKAFFQDWPAAKNRIPYQTMQEMRITPDLPVYNDLMEKLFFALMDAQLETPEAVKAFLEPFSPPAPPPPPSLRRRPVKQAKVSKKKVKAVTVPEEVTSTPAAGEPVPTPVAVAVEPPPVKPAKAAKTATAKPKEVAKAMAAKDVPAKAAAGKGTAAKAVAQKSPAKKAEPVKVFAKKASAEKKPAKTARKFIAAKKPAAKKPAAKNAGAKTVVKKAAPPVKKAVKAAVKKSLSKKTVAKKVTSMAAKKGPVKKAAPARKSIKKAVAKRR